MKVGDRVTKQGDRAGLQGTVKTIDVRCEVKWDSGSTSTLYWWTIEPIAVCDVRAFKVMPYEVLTGEDTLTAIRRMESNAHQRGPMKGERADFHHSTHESQE